LLFASVIAAPADASSDFEIAEAPIVSAGGGPGVSSGLEVALCVVDLSELGHCFPPPALNPIVFVADPAVAGVTVWRDAFDPGFAEAVAGFTNGSLDLVQYWTTLVPVSGAAGSIVTEKALLDDQVGPSGVDLFGYAIHRIGLRLDAVSLTSPPGNPGETDWELSATLIFQGTIAGAVACKDGGWQSLHGVDYRPFKNQGDCMQFVNTGK
jgi:hypothetical protein